MEIDLINDQYQDVLPQAPPRRIYSPVQKDAATFLETSAATNGRRTLLEIELAPGGGNSLHYHTTFVERFEVLEGELHLQLGKTIQTLHPTQAAVVPINTLHRFFNPTNQMTRFLVEFQPGHTGMEQILQIVYGLAADGKTNQRGIPTNLYHLAVILTLGDTGITGPLGLLRPVFGLLAARARKLGIEQELIQRYCQ